MKLKEFKCLLNRYDDSLDVYIALEGVCAECKFIVRDKQCILLTED